MAKKNKFSNTDEAKSDLLWRKPISLESFDEDPLANFYRGREAGQPSNSVAEAPETIVDKPAESASRSKSIPKKETLKKNAKKPPSQENQTHIEQTLKNPAEKNEISARKISERELKDILKIKDDFFHFTDIREILRGKSFDIYAYLRFLSGESGVCKIKHLDLMNAVNVSRPTLFKQQEWLTKLKLIEKRNVPGDHLGTSYTIHTLEEVLPLPENVIGQIETHIENLRQTDD